MKDFYDIPDLFDQEKDEELLDVTEYIVKLFSNWRFIFKMGVLGVVVGLVFALSAVKIYTVSASLIPEQTQKASGGLSSLASMAGVNLSSLGGSDTISPDLYPQIVSTTPFKVEMLNLPVTITGRKEGIIHTDLYTYFDKYQKGAWYKNIAELPLKIVYGCMGLFSRDEPEIDGGIKDLDPGALTYRQNEIMHRMSRKISVSVDKKSSLIYVSATMFDPEVAKQVCDQLVEKLQNYVVKYRTEKARIDVEYYQMLNDEAKSDYYEAQNKYARYVDANQGILLSGFLVERDRLQNESNLAFQLYNQTAQQLQLAMAKIQQDTPVWSVLEPTSIPVKGYPSRSKILILWTFLFGFFAVLWVLFGETVLDVIRRIKDDKTNSE